MIQSLFLFFLLILIFLVFFFMMRKKRTKKNKLRDWIMKTKMIDLLYYVAMVFYEKKNPTIVFLLMIFFLFWEGEILFTRLLKKKEEKEKKTHHLGCNRKFLLEMLFLFVLSSFWCICISDKLCLKSNVAEHRKWKLVPSLGQDLGCLFFIQGFSNSYAFGGCIHMRRKEGSLKKNTFLSSFYDGFGVVN